MITLFHCPKTRSTRFIFLLEELGTPYEIHRVTTRTSDGGGSADPANPHPHGKVPVITDGNVTVFESPAIALYLTDRFPQRRLGPLVGDPKRGEYLSWLSYYTGVLEPAFMSRYLNVEVPRVTAGWVPIDESLATIIRRLATAPYMLGAEFSALDVLYGTTFALFAQSPMMPKSQPLIDYIDRIVSRPAFKTAQAHNAG